MSVLEKIKENHEIFNVHSIYDLFQQKKVIEIHAEILAKFISYLDGDSKKLDDIGVSQPPCFLCGSTFSVIDKTNQIQTHGEYFLQDGLEKVLNVNIQNMFPVISTIELKDTISKNIRNILDKHSKETMLNSQKFTFYDKSTNLEDEKIELDKKNTLENILISKNPENKEDLEIIGEGKSKAENEDNDD